MIDQKEYLKLFDLTYHVTQSLEGTKYPDKRFYDCNKLAFKLFSHAATIYWLRQGTSAPFPNPSGTSFFDSASVAVITRSILETYLTMFELFFETISDDEREFRHACWLLNGLVIRENFTPINPEHNNKIKNSQIQIKKLRERIQDTKVYRYLSDKNKKRVLQGKSVPRELETRLKKAGFAPLTTQKMYQYLSSYIHSDGLSAIQLMDLKTRESQEKNIDGFMNISMIVMSKMILAYSNLFDTAKIACMDRPEAFQLANMYSNVASQLDEIKQSKI
ncbi:MAG: hypothetical protein JNK81_01580 [Anaerolineales bacterium]|nr:hypothetical protein [Anaerolineales bacterium]